MAIDPFVPSNVDLSRTQSRRSAAAGNTGAFAACLLAVNVIAVTVAASLVATPWFAAAWTALFASSPLIAYGVCGLAGRKGGKRTAGDSANRADLADGSKRAELTLPLLVTLFGCCAGSIAAFAVIDHGLWCLAVAGIALTLWPVLLAGLVWRIARLSDRSLAKRLSPAVLSATAQLPVTYEGGLQRNPVSPDRAYDVIVEPEPDGCGRTATTTTVFLTASECPVGCSMCDLWQNTLTTATPPGAIAQQIRGATTDRPLGSLPGSDDDASWIKLYNSGNFFDPRSIPPGDYKEIAALCVPFSRVIVENHPKIGVERMERFASLLRGKLEVAVGLETVQPRWLDRIGKKMTRDDFDSFAARLQAAGIDLRVFLIFGVPGCTLSESIRWARLSARHAAWTGARHISFIPARKGHGWDGRAAELQAPTIQSLSDLQQAALRDVGDQCVVTVDAWDADALAVTQSDRVLLTQVRELNLRQRLV